MSSIALVTSQKYDIAFEIAMYKIIYYKIMRLKIQSVVYNR